MHSSTGPGMHADIYKSEHFFCLNEWLKVLCRLYKKGLRPEKYDPWQSPCCHITKSHSDREIKVSEQATKSQNMPENTQIKIYPYGKLPQCALCLNSSTFCATCTIHWTDDTWQVTLLSVIFVGNSCHLWLSYKSPCLQTCQLIDSHYVLAWLLFIIIIF